MGFLTEVPPTTPPTRTRTGRRELITTNMSLSRKCKECIDESKVICQNANGSTGVCCESFEECKKREVDVCSYNAPQESIWLQYWSCPHALDVCGVENTFVPKSDGTAARVRPGGSYQRSINEFSMCRYRVLFPQVAGEFDQIVIDVGTLENVTAYLTETSTYKNLTFKEKEIEAGVK